MRPEADSGELVFNGIDLDTGKYLTPPVRLSQLAEDIRAEQPGATNAAELRRRHQDDDAHYGVIYGLDPEDLGQAAWGLVIPPDLDRGVLEALEPLVSIRREQAGDLYQQLTVQPGET